MLSHDYFNNLLHKVPCLICKAETTMANLFTLDGNFLPYAQRITCTKCKSIFERKIVPSGWNLLDHVNIDKC